MVAVLGLAGTSLAEVRIDYFDGVIQADGSVVPGSLSQNTGWDDGLGPWYEYPQGADPAWWNEWFYNDPPKPPPWYKEINFSLDVIGPGVVEVAINWSTLAFPPTGPGGPPPMALDEPFIMREIVYTGGEVMNYCGTFRIADYNPEWVSIDIRAQQGADIEVLGCI
ncbi:MAG: hypothetical protein AMJ81_13745, partial [Phycisphaerae bacterium SM23_33]